MGCGACSSSTGGGCSPSGCRSNGGCASGGCNRLNVFDWLSDMTSPGAGVEEFDIVEVRFKGGRKDFYRNRHRLPLITGDPVVVDVSGGGWHVGHVALRGELVRLQMRKKKAELGPDMRVVQRVATEADLSKLATAREQESSAVYRARVLADELRLQMKVSDVEYQADRSRATFYYSAEDRVDFRDLVKRLADEFRVRIEMRQISLRHEAGRLGGIGSCGRELCCSTWLTDFKTVSTTAARYQQLSLNPAKLAGQCGRLKCCLNYELDTYLDALRDIPTVSKPLQTTQGDAFLQKTDIFRRLMWFGFKGESDWHRLPVERVREIQEMNKRGEKPETLVIATVAADVPEPEVAIVEGSLERLDDKFKPTKKKKRKKKDKDKAAEGKEKAPKAPKEPRPEGAAGDEKADKPKKKKKKGPKPPKSEGASAPEPARVAAEAGAEGGPAKSSRRRRGGRGRNKGGEGAASANASPAAAS